MIHTESVKQWEAETKYFQDKIASLTAEVNLMSKEIVVHCKTIDRLQAALERIVNHPRLPLIVRTIAHNALNEETK